ncbi:hypothetical protein D3C78_1925240 [compost metagenome]
MPPSFSGTTATPHGLACLTMTQAGLTKLFTHSSAASVSATLLNDSSLPCSCTAVETLASPFFAST